MQSELIKEIISSVVGKSAEGIADILDTKKYINEFVIATKLDVTINQARNFLYKLSDFGLVSSIRKKDKKKGWYTYFWKIENLKALEFLQNLLQKKINQINTQINSRETRQFYVCEKCKLEFAEENALLMNFTCDECGDIFTLKDNTKILRELKKNSIKYENELKIVSEEIEKEKQKNDKQRLKEIEKEKKVKAKIRADKASERKKIKDLEKKKTDKKEKSKIKKILKTVKKISKKKISNKRRK